MELHATQRLKDLDLLTVLNNRRKECVEGKCDCGVSILFWAPLIHPIPKNGLVCPICNLANLKIRKATKKVVIELTHKILYVCRN